MPTAWNGFLEPRQKALYKHTCDIWSVTRTKDPVTGKPSGEIYTLVMTGVPCLYDYTPNVDMETEGGRIKEFTLLTTDKIHLPVSAPIADTWLTVNRTVLSGGAPSRSTNEVHRMLGAPKVNESLGRRHCNKTMMEGMTMEHPPAALVAYYPGMAA